MLNLQAPTVHWDLTTRSVLTMEFCEGGKINDFQYMKQRGIDCTEVCTVLQYSLFKFCTGFVEVRKAIQRDDIC